MRKEVLEFATSTSFHIFYHGLEQPAHYGLSSYTELYEMVTGDTAFDDLPQAILKGVGNQYDLENLAADWRDMVSKTLHVVRALKHHEDVWVVIDEVDKYV